MKKMYKFLFLVGTFMMHTVCSMSCWNPIQSNNVYCGAKSFYDEKLNEIVVNGSTDFEGTTVQKATINGSLDARKATIGTLVVNGSAYLEESVVEHDATINGVLETSKTTLQKLFIASREVILSETTATDIVMRKDPVAKVQKIKLRKGAQITGSITFESGNGEVWLSDDSSILGNVKGGKTLRK